MPTDTTPALPEPGKCQACEWVYYTPAQMLAALARAAELERERDALRATLERVTDNFRRSIAGKPVRDMAETFAEADAAVAAVPMLPNSDLGHQAQIATPGVRSDGDEK